MKFTYFDFEKLDRKTQYSLMLDAIVPRPIAFVSTCNQKGVGNLAPFSFFTGVASKPPSLVFSVTRNRDGSKKDTLKNIEATSEFVVNSSNEWLKEEINQASANYDYGVDEMEKVGLTSLPSTLIKPKRVSESAVQMECKLLHLLPIGDGGPGSSTLVVGEIVAMHVRSDCFLNGRIEIQALKPISRLGGIAYSKLGDVFDLPRPDIKK